MKKKTASPQQHVLHVCVDRPISTLNLHRQMYEAIKNNPANNPAKKGTAEHKVVESFVENPNQQFTPDEHVVLSRMAILTDNKWKKGQTLTVAFLDGSALQKKKTKKYARYWTMKNQANANITLKFVNGKIAMIRISFVADSGSWSTVGTDCNIVPADEPTMNFGWLRYDTDDAEWERVVVHEFGHALGCIHEHQSPAKGIKWNKPAVYKYYEGPPNNWSKADVDSNIFKKYSASITQFTTLDTTSIMMYFFPPEFTLDGFGTPENGHLSPTDIDFIRKIYSQ
ncbi:MAG: hypothetical protein M3Z56_00255 [Bacteroidota bacterium]|nr:hypothetical protein [Bacteroidota bacterium]